MIIKRLHNLVIEHLRWAQLLC